LLGIDPSDPCRHAIKCVDGHIEGIRLGVHSPARIRSTSGQRPGMTSATVMRI
jgi:hypothetical protein